ncbi:endophilin-B1-like [Scophthalmus maximus]|uniref:BAR domain-containing protein n=1 Tax=Scophthalmus maximus TaxID=52904 RepID=A0A8D3C159_SCOMX|nr:endophilin-B1-like [Scophthalmus maximus]
MDLTRLAVDAGQFINRAIQYTGESIGQADRTELGPGVEELLAQADATKTCTDKIISQTEVLLQPSPGARLEDRLYEHLEWSAPPRPRALEVLGNEMTQAGLEIGSNTPYGTALLRCGEAQKQLSDVERKFVQSTNIHFLTPLRSFTEGEYRTIQDERRMLLNKRLDLDIAKTRLRKAREAEREDRNLNANPLDDDYMSQVSYMFSFLRVKWLKIWAQQISQAEMELRICQSLYDRQSEITRRLLEGIGNTHTNHMRSLTDFVEAQACYFDQCNQHAQELRKQLASVPAVLCSNNWMSEISNQPSASNHISNEPTGLNQVSPIPAVVHQIPDFDQDSWTADPPPAPEKIATNSSVTTQPLQPTINNHNNNNNNNNNVSKEISYQSAGSRARRDVLASNSDNHPTGQLSAANGTVGSTHVTSHGSTAESSATSQTVQLSATAEETGGAGDAATTTSSHPSQPIETGKEFHTANAVSSSETMATNATADEPITTDETANEQPAVNGEDVQESSSAASEDVAQ